MALAPGDTVTFGGTTDDDWAVVTNWSPAEIPVDQTHCVIPDTTTRSLLQNVDRQGDSGGDGLNLRSLVTHPKYIGNIGTAGSPLKVTADNPDTPLHDISILHQGSGTLFYNAETGTGGHATSDIVIDSNNMDNAATIGGDVAISSLVCRRGHTTLISSFSSTISRLIATFRNNPSTDVKVTLESSATALALCIQNGGVVTSDRAITTYTGTNGVWTQGTQAVGTVYLFGGTWIHNTSSTITGVYLFGGVYDTTQTMNDKTITRLFRAPGATFLRSNRLTVTEEHQFNIPTL